MLIHFIFETKLYGKFYCCAYVMNEKYENRREVKYFAQDHAAAKERNWHLKSTCLAPGLWRYPQLPFTAKQNINDQSSLCTISN